MELHEAVPPQDAHITGYGKDADPYVIDDEFG
jgi:hypothetical protein